MILKRTLLIFLAFLSVNASAQSDYEKSGMQALMKGDFKTAVSVLEKAEIKSPNNTNVLKMLSYAYLQVGDNERAVSGYTKLLNLKPDEYTGYYYRGKARLNIANNPKEAMNTMRENFYQAAIKDFSKAIELNTEQDAQYYQNRALAYKDYGVFKSYKIKKAADKTAVIALFNSSVTDFQKILVAQPSRKDIIDWSKFVKDQIASLK